MTKKTVLAPNAATSMQTQLAAEVHLAEGQSLLEEQTLNIERELRDQEFQKGEA
jgi:hypothetical protein